MTVEGTPILERDGDVPAEEAGGNMTVDGRGNTTEGGESGGSPRDVSATSTMSPEAARALLKETELR